MYPVIITAALNGAEVQPSDTPALPVTPEQIAEEAVQARAAGAAIVHIHGRRPDGTPTQDRRTYRQFLHAIRERTDILVQFSTGGAVGMRAEERIEALNLGPDIATLSLGSLNFGEGVFLNSRSLILDYVARFNELGIPAELEIFDAGMLGMARYLIERKLLQVPYYYDFVMGVPGGIEASLENLVFLANSLPSARPWSVAGIGRHELPLAVAALIAGGHVRVGLEDNIYYRKGELATGNAQLVARIARIAAELDRPIATPAEARVLLGLS